MKKRQKLSKFDTIIVGGGAAGLFAALAFQHKNIDVALVAPPSSPDYRTTALMHPAIQALKSLDVFEKLAPHFAPLISMRLIDATGALFKSPEIIFHSHELELNAFGYNIENQILTTVLKEAFHGKIFTSPVIDYTTGKITLQTGDILTANLIVAADGRNSFIRQAAGIKSTEKNLPQTAFVCNFSHSLPHNNISTEFHTPEGPMTFVPMLGKQSSLVWVMSPSNATNLQTLDDQTLADAISKQSKRLFGRIELNKNRGFFPLKSMTAHSIIADNLALIGEAAHLLPPIGAQGLNLGFRDAAFLSEFFKENPKNALKNYEKSRFLDVTSRTFAVNSLNHSLLSNFMLAHTARAIGMNLIEKIPALRGFVMRQGLAPDNLPKIML